MSEFKLESVKRDKNGRQTRQEGFIPGVVYGNNVENISVAVSKPVFQKLYKEAGSSNLIDLSIGDDKAFKTLVQDVQVDPITLEVTHVDLFKVNMKEKIRTEIPLEVIGESAAVRDMEGILITNKDNVEVECLPADLPDHINVDITVLDSFDKDIRVFDLKVPATIEILDDPEEVLIHVEEPRSEEEIEALEEAVVEDVSAVEVEAEKKEGEEGEAETTEGKKEE